MKALVAMDKGGAAQLEYLDDVSIPYLGIGDVLVRVEAASFTPDELEWPSTWVDRSGRDRIRSSRATKCRGWSRL